MTDDTAGNDGTDGTGGASGAADATGTDDVEASADSDESAADRPLPEDAIDEAERLTRLARDAVDDGEREAYLEARADLLAEHDYTSRVREDDTRDVLVLHPDEWVEDGRIRTERIDDLDRGVERPLDGPGQGEDWDVVDEHNRDIVETVRAEHGAVHGANAEHLADFMSNHYAKAIERATRAELEEFLTDYYRRNAWPTDEQRSVVERSVALAFEAAGEDCPIEPRR